ncbi:spermatogenesis-defective protein 39 homolog isoform X2 [Mizuhopecten yessoensis]|uniref:spermatogenesis-defective protein 39 homolog isoform X2 n=1 Tax=Mizuhopecten yessoensis TaxID=6573 RepID=UPI000B45B4BD|nr:spermatogenesis-defective protein 39 homolog isoform X2 [Mizuhopecten yessoensis]
MAAFRKESQDDEDDYWSGIHKNKNKKKFNLFADDVSVEQADQMAKTKILLKANDFDEDSDTINWDGSSVAVTSTSTSSINPTVSIQPATVTSTYSRSTERLPGSSSNISLQEVVSNSAPRAVSSNDRAKMAEEIRFLQRSLQRAKESGTTKLPVEDTVRCMITGEPFSLEVYRCREEKIELLDRALNTHDGNAIITIVLFLQRTIKTSIFNLELQKRPVAVNHYINYLKNHYDFEVLVDLLGFLGRNEEAAMFKYKQAVSASDAGVKIKSLKTCHRAHFMTDQGLAHNTSLLEEHISLLERQRPIEDADARDEQEGKVMLFKSYPRKSSIINMSVITTLYYCCFYHPGLSENSLASPAAIRRDYKLTDKQYLWIALSARSRLKQWTGIEELFMTKGWFGGTKAKAVIGFDRVCEVLYKTSAPLDILSKYLRMIDSTDRRIALAKKMKCHDIVVDTYLAMKDRAELTDYAKKLTPHSREAYYAQDALKSSTVKWKN